MSYFSGGLNVCLIVIVTSAAKQIIHKVLAVPINSHKDR